QERLARLTSLARRHTWDATDELPGETRAEDLLMRRLKQFTWGAMHFEPQPKDPNETAPHAAFARSAAIEERPKIPGYEVLGELGRGGMGIVYRARQLGLQRTVAIKMVLHGTQAGPKDLARFRAEAAALARLQHPNIVQIYEVGEVGGRPYFAIE